MTQDEKWRKNLNEVVAYMDAHHRNPSKHRAEDSRMVTWLKHQRKLMNKGELRADRLEMFKRLMAKGEKLKRANQWEEVVAEIMENDLLRSYQQEMLERLDAAWMEHRSVMVQMPTGTGKTVLMGEVIRQRISRTDEGGVLIVAHRRELLEQIRATVELFGIDMENEHVYVESIQKLARAGAHRGQEPCNLESGDSYSQMFQSPCAPSQMFQSPCAPSLVIVDEAHHALAETYRELWDWWPEAKFLGLTATPCRLSGEAFTDLFDVLLQSWSVGEFIDKGWLSDLDYVSVKSDSAAIEKVAGLNKRGANGDYQARQAALVLDTEESVERLYRAYREFADGKKGIVYAINVEHARHIAEYYQKMGLNCAVIDTKTPAKERQKIVEYYRLQALDILVNCEIFTEGFDVPAVEFIQLARPTMSLSLYLQQVGRGMRVSRGKEKVIVLDQVGLYLSMGLPTAERDWQGMFLGEIKGKGLPLSQYRMSEIEMTVNRLLADKMLVKAEMVRLSDYERVKMEAQQAWDRQQMERAEEEKRQRRERVKEAVKEGRRLAKWEDEKKVDWHGSLGIYMERGRYGIKRRGGENLPPVYEQIEVLKPMDDRYFAIARLPGGMYGSTDMWTIITKDGEDLHLQMAGEYVRREDGIFEFWTKDGGRYVMHQYDVENGRCYADARLEKIGGVQFFRKTHEDGYILRGQKDDRKRFCKSDVVYNDHITIIGDELFVKSKTLKRYQIAGYHGDSVIVKDGEGLTEIGNDGSPRESLQRMPGSTTSQPDFLLLGLSRENVMSAAASEEAEKLRRGYQREMVEKYWNGTRKSKSVLLQIPTGAGKTWVVMPAIRDVIRMRRSYAGGGNKVLVVTAKKELVGQIKETIERCGIATKILKQDSWVEWWRSDVTITTTDFIEHNLETVASEYVPTLIVFDDVHQIAKNIFLQLQQRWPKANRIGVTATPIGLDGFALKKVFGQFVASPSLGQLIEEGWLKDIEYVDGGKDAYKSAERLCRTYLKHAKGKRGIVCAQDKRQGAEIAECYRRHGVKTAVCLNLATEAGRQQVENLRNGNLEVVVEVRQFSEGFRCPDIEFVQLARPTESLAVYMQQVECGMRMSNGKCNTLIVLDCVGAVDRFGLPTDERDWKAVFENRLEGTATRKRTQKGVAKNRKEAIPPPLTPTANKWQLRMQRLLGNQPSSRAKTVK